ncbi:unnamed protein product [Symbiodinium sp. CCMP2456]|nr:unnamed protein product [Symbiodinium sp. CCMP2456]
MPEAADVCVMAAEDVDSKSNLAALSWALSIKPEWCQRSFTKAGSGTLVGEATALESRPVTAEDLEAARHLHQIADVSQIPYSKPHAWILGDVLAYDKPVPYSHPAGCVSVCFALACECVTAVRLKLQALRSHNRRVPTMAGLGNLVRARAELASWPQFEGHFEAEEARVEEEAEKKKRQRAKRAVKWPAEVEAARVRDLEVLQVLIDAGADVPWPGSRFRLGDVPIRDAKLIKEFWICFFCAWVQTAAYVASSSKGISVGPQACPRP